MPISTEPVSESMWKALGLLSMLDRWRREEHSKQASLASIRALWRRGLVEAYSGFTEAYILPEGRVYLAENLGCVVIEYAQLLDIGISAEDWHEAARLEPGVVRNRLGMLARLETLKSQLQESTGRRVLLRPVFVRNELI